MTNKNKDIGRIGGVLFAMLITLFSLCFISGAGFGSTYLPKVDGELQLGIPIGSNVNYFIYPQNMENKTLLVKINITDENNLLVNQLQDYYEIPPQTSSDDVKIELTFHLANDTELIGKKYPIKFDVLSTYKTEDITNIVSFSPLGFSKSFFIVGEPAEIIIPPIVEPVYVPTTSSGGGSGSSSKGTTNSLQKPVLPKPTITEPTTNKPNDEGLLTNSGGTKTTEPEQTGKGSNALFIIIIIGTIVIVGVTIIVKKYGDM